MTRSLPGTFPVLSRYFPGTFPVLSWQVRLEVGGLPNLVSLQLRQNNVGSAGLAALAGAAASGALCALQRLVLGANAIGDEGVVAFAAAITGGGGGGAGADGAGPGAGEGGAFPSLQLCELQRNLFGASARTHHTGGAGAGAGSPGGDPNMEGPP